MFSKKKSESDEASKKEQTLTNIIGIVILLAIVGYCTIGQSSGQKKSFTPSESDAVIATHEFVKQHLVSPAIADFPFALDGEGHATKMDDSPFRVHSFVDSQNAFGATMRTNYSCKVVFHPDESYDCSDFKFLLRKV
jgi:hypothetical protein